MHSQQKLCFGDLCRITTHIKGPPLGEKTYWWWIVRAVYGSPTVAWKIYEVNMPGAFKVSVLSP